MPRMPIQENVPLAPVTEFHVGGPARYLLEDRTIDEIREGIAFAQSHELPLFVLGGGSNLLVSDAGWPGLVVKIALGGVEESGQAQFEVGAGEDWDKFVARPVAR